MMLTRINMVNLPTFIICGTQKGGTTSLYNYLKGHPEIFIPKKEIHFFDKRYNKGINWYLNHFETIKDNIKQFGEASPFYMFLEEVPERIYKQVPKVKLIFILRHPVDRAYSHYWHEKKLGYEKYGFNKAILLEENRLSKNDIFSKSHYSYKNRGKYIDQIKRFLNFFPRNQLYIILNDDLNEQPETVMKDLFRFLNIENNLSYVDLNVKYYTGKRPRIEFLQRIRPWIPADSLQKFIDYINLQDGYPRMDPKIRAYLIEYFKPYNKKLENFLGRKLDNWKK